MSLSEIAAAINRLADVGERIAAAVEQLGLAEEVACDHANAEDIGTMGTPPGSRMRCNDCGEIFQRIDRG
jgi:hypothetical protein